MAMLPGTVEDLIEVGDLTLLLDSWQLTIALADEVMFLVKVAADCIDGDVTVGWLVLEDDPKDDVPEEDEELVIDKFNPTDLLW